jgi:type II secretion system protein C
MGRLGIRIANAVLFILCSFQVANVVNKVGADALRPGPADLAPTSEPSVIAPPSWDSRQAILDRNLFDAQIFASAEPEIEIVEELEETKLPVLLLGTQFSSVREHSKAAIADRGAREHQVLREGEALEKHPQARLVRIERGRVILDNQGRREELVLAEAAPGESQRPLPRSERQSQRRASRPAPAPPAPIAERLRELQESGRGASAVRKLSQQARIVPKWEEGQMVGIELTEIEPGSVYEKIGLESGDVITSLNGIQLDSAAAGTRALSQIDQAEHFEIELSSGKVTTIGPEELDELLGQAEPEQ